MKIVWTGMMAAAMIAVQPGMAASGPDLNGASAQMVLTVRAAAGGSGSEGLQPGDLTIVQGRTPAPVVLLRRYSGDLADLQLFVLLDDSTRTSSLGVHLGELKTFLASLPPTTQVAVGYMRNGTFVLAQAFTADHQKAVASLRLPVGVPGENGSPYFALSDLVKHWPSKVPAPRRAVLMLTDGVDRYYQSAVMDDPYVDTSMHDALKAGVMVYSIYLQGAGQYGRGASTTTTAQSRMIEVSEETGGFAYFQDLGDPVTVAPFLKDFEDRLEHQYGVTLKGLRARGVQPVQVKTELRGLRVDAPTHIWVQ